MALNEQNTNPAYLCGRLFAVLEKVQQDASGGNLNRTIKDTYFSSASSRPQMVFPKLMRLSEFHLSKIEYKTYYIKLMGEIIDKLEENFPDSLAIQDQGKFIVGYYQQNKQLYTKTKEEN